MTARRLPNARPTPDRTAPADWRASAACAGDEDLYDRAMPSTPYGPPIDPDAQVDALAICAACPVRQACAAAMLPSDDPWHVAGGTTPRQRRNARRRHDVHACECGKEFTSAHALATHVGVAHREHQCTACPRRYRTKRGLSIHWSQEHAPETGRCIRGHAYSGNGGRCRECVRENNAARSEQKGAAA